MDGIVSSGLIKRNFPEAKIIMLTQYDDEEYRDMARTIGVIDYLLKDQNAKMIEVISR